MRTYVNLVELSANIINDLTIKLFKILVILKTHRNHQLKAGNFNEYEFRNLIIKRLIFVISLHFIN